MTPTDLSSRHCVPCGGGVQPLTSDQVTALLTQIPIWKLSADGKRIRREWSVKDFLTGLEFFQRIAVIAEAEDHHPDLHIESYRRVTVELWTHVANGLTENDFIVAAKIDQLSVEMK